MFWQKLMEMWSPVQSKEVPWMVCQECRQPRPPASAPHNPNSRLDLVRVSVCSSSSCHPASDAEGKVTVLSMAAQAILLSCSSPQTSGRAIPGCSDRNKNNPTGDVAVRAHSQQPHVRICHPLHGAQDFTSLPR